MCDTWLPVYVHNLHDISICFIRVYLYSNLLLANLYSLASSHRRALAKTLMVASGIGKQLKLQTLFFTHPSSLTMFGYFWRYSEGLIMSIMSIIQIEFLIFGSLSIGKKRKHRFCRKRLEIYRTKRIPMFQNSTYRPRDLDGPIRHEILWNRAGWLMR